MSKEARQRTDRVNVLLTVAGLAITLGRRHLAAYGSYKSRKDFTQAQLMACLILKTYKKTTYRGMMEELASSSELRQVLGMTKAPHWTTLQKFAARSNVMEVAEAMLGSVLEAAMAGEKQVEPSLFVAAAMDATGLETSAASAHFVSRSGRKRRRYIKVSVAVVCGAMLPASLVIDWGPTNDKVEARALMDKASAVVRPDVLYADAGYDAEWVHRHAHEQWGVATAIKPVKHKEGPPGGQYRSGMTDTWLKRIGYGMRWHVESFFSGMKRTMGSTLSARSDHGLFAEAALKVLAYALRR